MGSGKSSAAIQLMNDNPNRNYIFITPYLDEVQRIKQYAYRKFYEPYVHMRGGELLFKQESFHELLRDGKNIVSTHALFSRSNEETKELIYANDYTLILDEVMDVIQQIELKEHDLESLLKLEFITIDEKTGLVTWNEDKKSKSTQYDKIKDLCRNKSLYVYGDSVFMWTFPIHIFESFREVYNLTYLFDAQIQRYYYDLNGVKYEYYHAVKENNKYIFKKGRADDKAIKEELKKKIHIYEGNLNKIGDDKYALSKGWYSQRDDSIVVLKRNVENYLRNIVKGKSKEIMWTTFKDYENKLKGGGYSRSYTSMNLRSTNKYKDRFKLAYTVNRFLNPIIKGFFLMRDVRVNEDLLSVSELLQWIWRSGIRTGEEIYIYIPSKRMRDLFIQWLNDEL